MSEQTEIPYLVILVLLVVLIIATVGIILNGFELDYDQSRCEKNGGEYKIKESDGIQIRYCKTESFDIEEFY